TPLSAPRECFLTSATKSGSTITNVSLTVNYLLDPSNPIYNKLPGMKLYRQIMAKYDPKGNANDGLNLYGVAKAWNVVQLLQSLGKNPTRAGLMKAARNMNFTAKATKGKKANPNPFPRPRVDIVTKRSGQFAH